MIQLLTAISRNVTLLEETSRRNLVLVRALMGCRMMLWSEVVGGTGGVMPRLGSASLMYSYDRSRGLCGELWREKCEMAM
jgi:hypothetical protein